MVAGDDYGSETCLGRSGRCLNNAGVVAIQDISNIKPLVRNTVRMFPEEKKQ